MGGDEFAGAVAAIDRRLSAEIRERQRHRVEIAQLAAGDSLALPPEAVAHLERLRGLGIPELMIAGERDGWILVAARLPERMPFYMKLKQQQLDDPVTLDLYRQLCAAIHWEADDPRVVDVVDPLVGLLDAADAMGGEHHAEQMTDDLAAPLDSFFLDSVPIAHRFMELLEERGWRGWTNLERTGPAHP